MYICVCIHTHTHTHTHVHTYIYIYIKNYVTVLLSTTQSEILNDT